MDDQQTFERVFTRFYAPLCQFATRYLAESADAEDVVESVFIRLWDQQGAFTDADHARASLYRATYHACLNHQRSRTRALSREDDYAKETGDLDEGYLPNLLRAELIALIHREIDQLPAPYAEVLRLSFREERSNDEIARELGLQVQTIKNYKHRGLALLKKRIPKELYLLFLTYYTHF